MKNDQHAREHWGLAYDQIPKSVFATLAWHLANVASGCGDSPGAAETRAIEELRALSRATILPDNQALSAIRNIKRIV